MKQLTKEAVYETAKESFGIVPPMIKEIAEFSVPVAALYVNGVNVMETSAFSEIEINAVELGISTLNGCESCMKGHSFLVKKAGLNEEDVQAIIHDRTTSIDSLNRILAATDVLYYANRHGYSKYLETLEAYELTRQEIFEIIGLLSLKTISNNINNYLKAVRILEKAA